jgi:hypothetical protein
MSDKQISRLIELGPQPVSGAGPAREQPHLVLGPKSAGHVGRPCGAKRGAPFAVTRYRV